MNFLEDRIAKDGIIREGNILKVDSFLNHQMDVDLIDEIGKEFYRRFKDSGITKILTIEASGIAIAYATAKCFNVPFVFAKKSKSVNIDNEIYVSEVESFTHKCTNKVVVSKKFLNSNDKVLIIDDFLAEGNALLGLIDLCNQAGAKVAGCAIAVEKAFQQGGKRVRDMGIRVESLARVESMSDDALTFVK